MSKSQTYQIDGLACEGCAETAQKAVERIPGVQNAKVDFATKTLTVTGDVDRPTIEKAVTEAGYALV